ncbi:MAG: TIGR01777 family oxidoreductase, partial [Vulcanimicrobiaceae bacterium]
IVNLAGESVAQRWNAKRKAEMRRSRVDLPHAFLLALEGLDWRPKAYLSASAIGYYGTSESAAFVETNGPGTDFLAELCVAWEAEADRAAALGMRVAKIRTGLVLGTDGGALPRLVQPFRLGVGGIVGSGRQWYSWIHIDDLVGIYLHALDGADGVLNGTAPNPVRNADFARALGAVLHRPTVFPAPAFAIEALFGEGATMVVEGQRVLPERTLASGYRFSYETIERALASLLDPAIADASSSSR